jgi:carboxyl-terminal processing protease
MIRLPLARVFRGAALGACAFAGGALATTLANAGSADAPFAFLRQLARVLVLVEDQYVEPVDRARLLEGAIEGMVSRLDPHSAYLPAEDYAIFRGDTQGEFGGIGVEVDFQADAIVVIAPIEGSPAARAGVQPGDRIIAINGSTVRGKSSQELVRVMRGQPGTKVTLTLRREGLDKALHLELTREVIHVSSVTGQVLDGGYGYLRVKQFQSGTHGEVLRVLGDLREGTQGRLRGILLDLRNNPGGLVDEAVAVTDEFLQHGVIYTTRHRQNTVEEVRARRGGAFTRERLVVLVNQYSASAAELVAGALQDHDRATVVGASTFGKGSVQSILDLPNGAGLRLTTMRYYTPGGRAIQAQGIEPHVLVEAAYVADKSFGVIKERDLENHLPAEGSLEEAPTPEAAAEEAAREGAPEASATHLGVARTVPRDPTGGPDFALSIGYQILKGVLKR